MTIPPLTPFDCDLRDFQFMPLDVSRLRDSDLVALEDAEAFRAAVLLWGASWHQVPAASLPNDDRVLASLAGYGRVVKEWLRVKEGALRNFVECSDGRLYHPVVAEKARESWQGKLRQRWATECARIKKHNQRAKENVQFPTFEAFCAARPGFVPRDTSENNGDKPTRPQGRPEGQGDVSPDCPQGNTIQGTGIGTERDKDKSLSSAAKRASRLKPDWEPTDADRDFSKMLGFKPDAISRMADRFRNYWTAKAGATASKLDWAATWRNWALKEAEDHPPLLAPRFSPAVTSNIQ